MPKQGEKERKLKQLSSGYNVRPPKKWFDKLKSKIAKQYPHKKLSELNVIVGGIWQGSSLKTKKNIVKKYQI